MAAIYMLLVPFFCRLVHMAVVVCGVAWKPQPPPFTLGLGIDLMGGGGAAIAFEFIKAFYLESSYFFVAVL